MRERHLGGAAPLLLPHKTREGGFAIFRCLWPSAHSGLVLARRRRGSERLRPRRRRTGAGTATPGAQCRFPNWQGSTSASARRAPGTQTQSRHARELRFEGCSRHGGSASAASDMQRAHRSEHARAGAFAPLAAGHVPVTFKSTVHQRRLRHLRTARKFTVASENSVERFDVSFPCWSACLCPLISDF